MDTCDDEDVKEGFISRQETQQSVRQTLTSLRVKYAYD